MHSNVGGGLPKDGLANGALEWIVADAESKGLPFNRDFLNFYKPYHGNQASEKLWGYRVSDWVMGHWRGYKGVRSLLDTRALSIDQSTFERLNADPSNHDELDGPYRPENLIAFLIARPQYDSLLSADLLESIAVQRSRA